MVAGNVDSSDGPGEGTQPMTTTAPTTLLAVDGNSLAHRAWHAITGGDDEVGEFVAAGVLGLITAVWDFGPYDALLVAFDHAENRRKTEHPHYKAGRETDPDLQERLVDLHDRLAAMGVHTVTEHGLEADDLLAAATRSATERGWRTDLFSGDRDLTALVDDRVRLLRPRGTMSDLVVTTPAVVATSYGVTPAQYHDFAALRGDTSDGLPGVDGIGPKSAAALLADFGDLDQLYANLCYLPTKLERALRQGRDRAHHNRALMQPLAPTVDIAGELDRAARLDLDAVVTVLEDLGVDDPGLARSARRITWARQRAAAPRPDDVPIPPEPAPRPDESPTSFGPNPDPDAELSPGTDPGSVTALPAAAPVFVEDVDDATQAALF